MSAAGSNPAPSAGYHVNTAAVAAVLGVLAVGCGGGVLATLALAPLRDRHSIWSVLFWCLLVAIAVMAALLAVAAVRLLRGRPVLVLDADGYRIDGLRGAGVRSADWSAVDDVVSVGSGSRRVVEIRLRDGRKTSLPVRLIEEPPRLWLTDLDNRLNSAHRQRRLR
ncbi:hypothetical protein BH18ACT8_BH18ACT8_13890 [soil metagenome]